MKHLLITIAFAFLFLGVIAQNTNCWYSTDYILMGDRFGKGGLKKVKNAKAWVCFNNHAVSLFTVETGLITFSYMDTWSGVDSTYNNQVKWSGCSGDPGNSMGWCEWTIDMTYNHHILINKTNGGAWGIQLNKIAHSEHAPVTFNKK